jgi:hypothetical protein
LLTQHFHFTESQRDAVELCLDVMSDLLIYKRTSTTDISFTLLNRVDEPVMRNILANLQQVLNTKDYAPRVESVPEHEKTFLDKIIDKFRGTPQEEGK